jgi:hypothetical protein
METATSRPALLALAALALAFAAGGCGGSASTTASTTARTQTVPAGSAFAWLNPGPAPASWHAVTIATGATLPYPATWHLVAGDKGTATAVLLDGHHYLGYLNLTPRQANETVANWPSFRIAHNADEGDRNVKSLAVGRDLHFRSGRGVCVRDSYTTPTSAKFIEIACLVGGPKRLSVIVGAAPPGSWTTIAPSLERAISSFTT